MKEYRNVFLDHLSAFSGANGFGDILADEFEQLYNSLYSIETFKPGASSCGYEEFDLFRIHVWELFVCATAFMLLNEMYNDLHEVNYTCGIISGDIFYNLLYYRFITSIEKWWLSLYEKIRIMYWK